MRTVAVVACRLGSATARVDLVARVVDVGAASSGRSTVRSVLATAGSRDIEHIASLRGHRGGELRARDELVARAIRLDYGSMSNGWGILGSQSTHISIEGRMKLEIILDPQKPGFAAFQNDLAQELKAFGESNDAKIKQDKAPPPEGTLAVEEVVRFVIEYREEIVETVKFVTAVVNVVRIVLQRHKSDSGNEEAPPAILKSEADQLELPCSDDKARQFADAADKEED